MDPKTDPASQDYRKVKAVIDQAIGALRTLGAEVVDPVVISDLSERVNKPYDGNVFETEPAINAYLAQHPNVCLRTSHASPPATRLDTGASR